MRPSVSPVENALLVQRNLGNTAYDVVLFVAHNMELIQSVADQLEKAKVVYVVDEEDLGKVDFKLVQNVRTVKGTTVTDWVFVDGKWEKLTDTAKQTKTADIHKNLTISLTEGQTTVGLPDWVKQIYGVFLNGIRLVEGNTYKYLPLSNYIELPKNYAQQGDELTIDIGSLEANRDALTKDLVFIHNKENNAGMALGDGSEQFFELPNTITDVYHNGIRLVHEVSQGGYYDEARGGYVLYSPLAEGDTLVIKYKGEV